ncbi:MAG: BMC domain-containing protein [Betaproteobacteria bacterium]
MSKVTINSLGYVEVRGLAAAIETADSMLKCAEVRLLRQLSLDPAQITLTVEGSLGACRAAVDAGQACAQRLGAFIASQVQGRPARDTESFVLALAEAGRKPFGEMPQTFKPKPAAKPTKSVPEASLKTDQVGAVPLDADSLDLALINALTGLPGGYSARSLSNQLKVDLEAVQYRLETLCSLGKLAKRRGRYHLLAPESDTK